MSLLTIERVWRYRSEPNRIHYLLRRADGTPRRLYADRGSALFTELEKLP